MNNMDRFKRRISALDHHQFDDEASKRRRILSALGGGSSSGTATSLFNSGVSTDELLSQTGLMSSSAMLAPLAATTTATGAFSLPSQSSLAADNALRQLLLPTAAPQPPHMSAALQHAALDEMVLGNFGPARLLESSVASRATNPTDLRGLLLAKKQQQEEEVNKTQALLRAKQEEEVAERLLAQKKEETKKQAALLLNRSSDVVALLRTPNQTTAATTPSMDALLNNHAAARSQDLNHHRFAGLSQPSSLLPLDQNLWLQDDLDAKATQLLGDLPGLGSFSNRRAKQQQQQKTNSSPTAAELASYSQLIAQRISDSSYAPSVAAARTKGAFGDLKAAPQSSMSLTRNEDTTFADGLTCLPVGTAASSSSKKDFAALGIEEDSNWLSEMHCFLRSEIVEVFHVENSKLTGRSTSKGLSAKQVGIRCRWCADMPPESRVSRSSAFPSSLRQLYQSFTMMVRDHFGPTNMCTAIPPSHREHLNHLRHSRNSQGASDSKHYWVHAAHKIGMVDSDEGIQITTESKAAGKKMGNFGAPTPEDKAKTPPAQVQLLVKPEDIPKGSMFLYSLLLQTQLVHLQKSELVAKRRTLPEGLEGIGCRHCCAAGRYGFSRRFPLRRRSLPEEIMDMYCHLKRCPLCPKEVKDLLNKLHDDHERAKMTGAAFCQGKDGRGKDPHREFFDTIWTRLGRTQDIKT